MSKQIKSKTLEMENCFVTLHEHSAGTLIFNITESKKGGQHAAIWVSNNELLQLSDLLREWTGNKGLPDAR